MIARAIRDFLAVVPNGGWNSISAVYGALAGAKLAFEREVVIPFENLKRHENGAVFNED